MKSFRVEGSCRQFLYGLRDDHGNACQTAEGQHRSECHEAEHIVATNAAKEKDTMVIVVEATAAAMIAMLPFDRTNALADMAQCSL